MGRFSATLNSTPAPRHPFFWVALAVTVVLTLLALSTAALSARYWNDAKTSGVSWEPKADRWIVASVRPTGPSAGKLRRGDAIEAVNGDTRAAYLSPYRWYESTAPGNPLALSILRGDTPSIHVVTMQSFPVPAFRTIRSFAVAIAMILMAAMLGLVRPEARTTRMGFWAGTFGTLVFLGPCLETFSYSLQGWEKAVGVIAISGSPWQFPIGFHFLSLFPVPTRLHTGWRILRWALYAVASFLWLPAFAWRVAQAMDRDISRTQLLSVPLITLYDSTSFWLTPLLWATAGAAMLAVVIVNYRALPEEGDRRRVRFAALGAAPSLVMLLLLGLSRGAAELLGYRTVADTSTYRFFAGLSAALVALAPLTMAYAILKHRLMGVRLAMRRGVQYLLAKNVLQLLLFSPVLAIVWEMAAHPQRSLLEIFRQKSLAFNLFVLLGAAASLRFRHRILEWLDRRFFRTVYSQERILLELLDQVKQADSINEISQLVANKVDAALHPKDLYIFYRDNVSLGFTLGYPEDARAERALQALRDREILEVLESTASTPFVITAATALDEPLDAPKSSLIVPLTRADQKVAGVLWLDERKSEEPYTDRDKDLLQMLAGQIAVVHENLRLKEQLADEQRVRLNVLGRLDERAVNLMKECPVCGECFDRAVDICARDGTELTTPIPVERVVEKKYRLDRRLGAGGMGGVYQATDLHLNRTVAIKVMVGRLFGNRVALRRFEREARTSARLRHPNIVTIHDFGRLQGEGAYLVMEFLSGTSWRSEMSRRRSIPAVEAASWLKQLCLAMRTAHAAGVVHRDIKPENLMIAHGHDGQSHVTVLDFGLAKIRELDWLEAATGSLTATGVVMGTLRYMAPEQLAGKDVDARSDVYSIGLVTLEILFGGFPAKSRDLFPWLETTINDEALRHPYWTGAEELQLLFKRILAADPNQRCASAADVQRDLIPVLRSCPVFGIAAKQINESETRTVGP